MRKPTLRQTLGKSIKYTLAHGYVPMPGYSVKKVHVQVNKAGFGFVAFLLESETAMGEDGRPKQFEVSFSIADILFDHGWAKAQWHDEVVQDVEYAKIGEDGNDLSYTSRNDATVTLDGQYSFRELPAYQYHLQELALLSTNWERIVYVGNNS